MKDVSKRVQSLLRGLSSSDLLNSIITTVNNNVLYILKIAERILSVYTMKNL